MTDYYEVLNLRPNARADEVTTAFEAVLSERRARRRKTGDVHAAMAVLGDPFLRRAYDAERCGGIASDRIVRAKAVTVDFASDVVPDIDVHALVRQARQVCLKSIVLVSGLTVRVAGITADVARAVQVAAARGVEDEA